MAELSVETGTPAMAAHTDIGVTPPALRWACSFCNRRRFAISTVRTVTSRTARSTARMSLETLALICRRVFESPRLGRQLEVAWHGGEPLVVPLAWYEDAIALMAERRPASLQLTHRFQSNGVLLNEDWARFFARIDAGSGSASTVRQTCTMLTGARAMGRGRTTRRCARSVCCRTKVCLST